MRFDKAQAWGIDLVLAFTIFFAALIVFFFYALNFPTENDNDFSILEYEGKILGDSLLSEGYPVDWDSSDVTTIGILSDGAINETKLSRFYDLSIPDYERTKGIFNIVNNYYIYFDEPIFINLQSVEGIGMSPENARNAARTTRIVIYQNRIRNLNINVWE